MNINMTETIKRIAVFTSGGDAPGMNAAIRAVVRTASHHDLHVYGIYRGYQGMVEGDLKRLEKRDVGNIIHRGGTILKTARSMDFMTKEGRKKAFENLKAFDIDACVAIGGNGTLTGAKVFTEEYGIPFVGLPGTIDNDLAGTDFSIGFDTAVNTAMEAVDKIRDTAASHNRLFFIEVMGRHSGYIALYTAIGSGAGSVLIPEVNTTVEALISQLKQSHIRKKQFSLVIVAEGNENGNAHDIAKKVEEELGDLYEAKVTTLGHLQRGGSPSSSDRVLSSRLGHSAVMALLEGRHNVMVGVTNGKVSHTPIEEAIQGQNEINKELIEMSHILAI
jgi:6-phosphofructokinase 1